MAARGFWTRAIGLLNKALDGLCVGRSDCRKRAADFSRTARNPRRPADHYAPDPRRIGAIPAKRRPKASAPAETRSGRNVGRKTPQSWRPDRESGARSAAISAGGANASSGNLRATLKPIARRPGARIPSPPKRLLLKDRARPRPVESGGPRLDRSGWPAAIRIRPNQGPVASRASHRASLPGAVREPAGLRPCADLPGSANALRLPIFSPNQLICREKLDCGAFGAKSSDNYATSSRKRGLNSTL